MENSENSTSSSEKPTSNPFSRALKVFLRLFVAIMVGLAIGLGLYFGGVTLYRIAVGPGPSYDQQVEDYQEEVAQLRLDLAERDLEIEEQQSGLERLINDGADLSASHSEAITEQMTVLAAELAVLTDRLDTFEVSLSEVGQPIDEMQGQLQLIRAMTLLSRAQFWLSEDNLGQASEDVTSARVMVSVLAEKWRGEETFGDSVTVLDEIVSRLDIALEDIRTQPTIAEDEIEIAWKLLIVVTDPENSNAD